MRLAKQLRFLPILFFVIACAYGQDIHYNYDRGANYDNPAHPTGAGQEVTDAEGRPTRTDPYLCASPRRSTGGQVSPPQRYLFLRCRTPTTAGDSRKASAAGPRTKA